MRFLVLGDFSYDLRDVPDDIKEMGRFIEDKDARVILNLEGPVTDGKSKGPWKRGRRIRQEGACMEALKTLHTTGVTLANNHMMDFGEKGVRDTLSNLDRENILHTGAGADLKEALEPMVFKNSNETVAFFNFGWDAEETVYATDSRAGCAPRKNGLILRTVKEYALNNPGHKVIVILHWGFEYNLYPMPYDIDLAHRLCGIENVYAVIGHHPHCPQTCETYEGKPVYYSLGNFYFGSRRPMFSKKKFKFDPEDMGNYGVAVLLDTISGSSESFIVRYDPEKDRSVFSENDRIPAKMPDIDHRSKQYLEIVSDTMWKRNPILGTNRIKNTFDVFTYNLARNIMKYL